MRRRHLAFRPDFEERGLEPRLVLSGSTVAVALASPAPTAAVFHHPGINGLMLHHDFLTVYNNRVNGISGPMMSLVSQAFSVFLQQYQALPVNPAPGTMPPALSGALASLTSEVDRALTVRQILSNRPASSVANGPKVSHRAEQALVPYANEQIAQLGTILASAPPVTGPNGTLQPADGTAAVNAAFNAIANAIAEYSIHPVLFTQPSDFYISPNYTFSIGFSGAPATTSPGYFVRGPGGQILPGAPLHVNFPA